MVSSEWVVVRCFVVVGLIMGLPIHALAVAVDDCKTTAPFYIQVVDQETGRGIPLAMVSTQDWVVWWTDSNGIAAITESDLQPDPATGRSGDVWIYVSSWGYTDPADGGDAEFPGHGIVMAPGSFERVELRRDNRAERLYRFTGAGVFRDSLLAGVATPLTDPTHSAKVAGQDSTQVAYYKGRVMYFFGDTLVRDDPFGVFSSTGASTSLLDVNASSFLELEYFLEELEENSTSPVAMVPIDEWFTWVQAFATVDAGTENEALLGFWAEHDGDTMNTTAFGSMIWDDVAGHFQLLKNFTGQAFSQYCTDPWCSYVLWEGAHSLLATRDGEPCNASDPEAYVYLACTTPLVRFPLAAAAAAEGAFESFALWESYTPLVEGATLAQPSPQLERDPTTGSLVYGWKRGTGALGPDDEQAFIARGEMAPDESLVWGATTDAETGDTITLSGGDIQWSEHRQKWVYISQKQDDGNNGEVWYSESDELLGPYDTAVKIITHEDNDDMQHTMGSYTFYNVVQYPFAAEGGYIFISGTADAATDMDNSARANVARYDYNNIIYRLDLDGVAPFFDGGMNSSAYSTTTTSGKAANMRSSRTQATLSTQRRQKRRGRSSIKRRRSV